jgi:hypothetical protein
MIVLVNYGNSKYEKAKKLNTITAKYKANFDKIYSFSPEDIDTEYVKKHKKIFSVQRGNGLWLWKPYFTLRVLNNLREGDILFYCDSAAFFIGNAHKIIEKMNKEFWVTELPLLEEQFTSAIAFKEMKCDTDRYKKTNQIQASFFALRKTNRTVNFVKEWLFYCENYEILTGSIPRSEEGDKFISHREDQSIFSLLCKKYKIEPSLDPTQYGKLPEKYYYSTKYIFNPSKCAREYKPFIILHRTPDANFCTCFKQYLCATLPRCLSLKLIIGLNR